MKSASVLCIRIHYFVCVCVCVCDLNTVCKVFLLWLLDKTELVIASIITSTDYTLEVPDIYSSHAFKIMLR